MDARPRALSKAELHRRLWPDTFVSDANLASLIKEVRDALQDDARQPRYIRTAHRFGYAFCGIAAEDAESRGVADVSSSGEIVALFWLVKDGKRVTLDTAETVIGRDIEGGLRVKSPTVSRRHARILITPDGATIEDLDSKNGTFVRGQPVHTRTPLVDGDEIQLGSVVMRFRAASKSRTATWTGPGR